MEVVFGGAEFTKIKLSESLIDLFYLSPSNVGFSLLFYSLLPDFNGTVLKHSHITLLSSNASCSLLYDVSSQILNCLQLCLRGGEKRRGSRAEWWIIVVPLCKPHFFFRSHMCVTYWHTYESGGICTAIKSTSKNLVDTCLFMPIPNLVQ